MVDLYQYLKEAIVCDPYIKTIYVCTGLSRMEELLQNARDIQMPCILVDVGVDGTLDLADKQCLKTFQSFYVLENFAQADAGKIAAILERTKQSGLSIVASMAAQSRTPDDVCYGFDTANIGFSAVGPVGAYCYGYAFNLTFCYDC